MNPLLYPNGVITLTYSLGIAPGSRGEITERVVMNQRILRFAVTCRFPEAFQITKLRIGVMEVYRLSDTGTSGIAFPPLPLPVYERELSSSEFPFYNVPQLMVLPGHDVTIEFTNIHSYHRVFEAVFYTHIPKGSG